MPPQKRSPSRWLRENCVTNGSAPLLRSEGFDAVAVAHNLNDNIETFFINLLRGTGLNGLTGMSPRHNDIIRPLLFATRNEIKAFATEKKIKYREDSSNAEVKYTRNRIRHMVLPEIEKVNPRGAMPSPKQ